MSKRGGDFVNKYEVMFIAKPLEEAEVDPIVELVSNLAKYPIIIPIMRSTT